MLGVRVPADWPQTVPARRRRDQLAAEPAAQPWLVRATVLRSAGRVVGTVGFHAPPDELGRVEIGYEILPDDRRRGYAREAVRALTDWAFATGEARICVASISPDNQASLCLVKSLGFTHVGEQIDEEDGPELIFERPLPLDDRVRDDGA
jgi:RimJ/RimL family protein N-acetyltransferase